MAGRFKTNAPPRFSEASSAIVTVKIGPTKKPYYIHRALLTHRSEYFLKALSGPWKEAQDQAIELKDVDAAVFEFFIQWLYYRSGSLLRGDLSRHVSKELNAISANLQKSSCKLSCCGTANRLLRVYVFADRFNLPRLQCYLINGLYKELDPVFGFLHLENIEFAYKNVPGDSPLLALMIDWWCYESTWHFDIRMDEDYKAELASMPPLFVYGVMRRLTDFANSERRIDTSMPDVCDYHQHKSDEERKACKKERENK